MTDRVLCLQGVHNFRDYGGYAARGGARLRTGQLFRSGHHVDATPEDLCLIEELNLATIIDLRGDRERALYPCARPKVFRADVIFAAGETAGSGHAPHVSAAQGVSTAEEAHVAMARLYESMPFRPKLVEVFRLYFKALADNEGASLLHCLAGKDRTGLAVGLLHSLLGVHMDDIMEDYLLTNFAGDAERRIAAGADAVRANMGEMMDDDAVRTVMSVHPAYLETAFSAILAQHGTVEAYARDVLGVSDARRGALEQALLC